MPNPDEVATVSTSTGVYSYWKTIEAKRVYGTGVAEVTLTIAEPNDNSQGSTGIGSFKLKPGDQASVTLAGETVINGYVWLRQASMDAESHAVQIGIASPLLDAVVSTVDGSPGQYQNYTLQQIASAVLGKVGVGFRINGSPSGADKPFPRVSEHIGETRFELVERLCRMRNLHLVDDGQGNLIAARGSTEGVAATLVEGQNIKRARIVLRNDEMADHITGIFQNFGTNSNWGDQARDVAADASVPNATRYRPIKIVGEQPGDAQDASMRVNHETDWFLAQYMDCVITVQGWLMDSGDLWWDHVGAQVTVVSPTLIPDGTLTLWLKGVVHRQSDQAGTETDLIITNLMVGTDQIQFGGGSSDPTALPDAAPSPSDGQ